MGVQDTVYEAMGRAGLGSYRDRATPVIEALKAREAEIAERLIDYAQTQGLSEGRARDAVGEAGLEMPTLVDDSAERTAAIDAMQDTINKLQREIDALR